MEKHIFISYKHEDSDFAEVLIHRIEKAGFRTWIDTDQLCAGEDWRAEIDQAIKNSFALIVVMSPAAKASKYITYEWVFAWGTGVKVIPILYRDTPLHPRLEALQYLNFTNRASRPWEKLLNIIQGFADTSSSSTLPTPQNTASLLYSESQKTKEFWLDTGKVFLKRKEYQEALDIYKQATLLNPNDASAYKGKSEVLNKLKNYKEALTAAEQAISLDPSYAPAYNGKGDVLAEIEQYSEALTAYDQAISLNPNDPLAYASKGNTLANLKRYDEALTAYDQAILLDPNNNILYYRKGAALEKRTTGKTRRRMRGIRRHRAWTTL
jgi:tetratricopeptide (TPR) repeat protein